MKPCIPIKQLLPIPSSSLSLATTNLLSVPVDLLILDISCKWNCTCGLCVWCLSLSIIFLRCIHIVSVKMLLSRVQLFVIPWTVAFQAPLSMGFSREEYWSRWPFPSPKDLTNPGMELGLLQAGSLPSEPWGKPQVSGKWWIFAPMRISEHSSLLFGMRALSRKL